MRVLRMARNDTGGFVAPMGSVGAMLGRIGRFFTAIGVVLLIAAWLWWLYLYRSAAAIDCLYLPGVTCPAAENLAPVLALPPYEPMVLWVGAAAVLLGFVLRVSARA